VRHSTTTAAQHSSAISRAGANVKRFGANSRYALTRSQRRFCLLRQFHAD
jgi:hypothetical protein